MATLPNKYRHRWMEYLVFAGTRKKHRGYERKIRAHFKRSENMLNMSIKRLDGIKFHKDVFQLVWPPVEREFVSIDFSALEDRMIAALVGRCGAILHDGGTCEHLVLNGGLCSYHVQHVIATGEIIRVKEFPSE